MMLSVLDQARGLRRMMRPAGARVLPVFGTADRVPALVNLAAALARSGEQVLVLDVSRGEIAPACGLCARYELKHVLEGEVAFDQAALSTRDGVKVLPAARGMRMLREARVSALDFFESLAEKAAPAGLILVNCEPAQRAGCLLPAHGEAVLVLSPGAHAISDGAACLRALTVRPVTSRFRVLMMRTPLDEARRTVKLLARLAAAKLDVEVVFGGNTPPERHLVEAARARRTIFDIDPAGAAARAFLNAAQSALDWDLAALPQLPHGCAPVTAATTKLH